MAVPIPPTGISQSPLHLAKTLAPRCPTIPLPASPSPRRQCGRPRQQEQAAGREVTPGRRRSRRARHPAQLKHILFGASCILPHPRARRGGVGGSARGQHANCSPGDSGTRRPPAHRPGLPPQRGVGDTPQLSPAPPRCAGVPLRQDGTCLRHHRRGHSSCCQLRCGSLRTQGCGCRPLQARPAPPSCKPPLASPQCRCTSPTPGSVPSRHRLLAPSHQGRAGIRTQLCPLRQHAPGPEAGFVALLLTLFDADVN